MTETKNAPISEFESVPVNDALRFRIVHLLYLIAAVASSLATFGVAGIVPAAVITIFWASVFTSRSRPRALLIAVLVSVALGCLGMCMLPAFSTAREAARRTQCNNNLKNIALGLQNYHDTYKTFPPAYIADENGKPMHSWRVLILPFMEERQRYDQYDFSQPWDAPANRKLMDPIPDFYACPSEIRRTAKAKQMTSYVAVVGDRTAWPGAEGRSMSEIVDGTSNTILVVEVGDLEVPWMKPEDISLDDCVRLLHATDLARTDGHRRDDFFYEYNSGRLAALVNGSVQFLQHGLPSDVLSDLMTIDDGNSWELDNFDFDPFQYRRSLLGNWFRLGLFFFIAVFPTPWVWLNPGPGHGRQRWPQRRLPDKLSIKASGR